MNAQAENLKELMAQFTVGGAAAPVARQAKVAKSRAPKRPGRAEASLADFEKF